MRQAGQFEARPSLVPVSLKSDSPSGRGGRGSYRAAPRGRTRRAVAAFKTASKAGEPMSRESAQRLRRGRRAPDARGSLPWVTSSNLWSRKGRTNGVGLGVIRGQRARVSTSVSAGGDVCGPRDGAVSRRGGPGSGRLRNVLVRVH